ncbi:hypothetical protein G7092_20920 [Mucilaginibacter sp. HC2]|uniref:hypothetical protein n=1 Tax=Mucilaginibacter inviolabilis TaxID=2714892 RepID=UPI00140D3108|nr:hypothetical protein [Mucilaginibacter inviolabilis]NHA06285.1 hypothetical protein [Mucilaginibacter inviolabilis]
MKKAICMIALAAISASTVFAYAPVKKTDGTVQTDTTKTKKKWKNKKKKDSTKKDTTKM